MIKYSKRYFELQDMLGRALIAYKKLNPNDAKNRTTRVNQMIGIVQKMMDEASANIKTVEDVR